MLVTPNKKLWVGDGNSTVRVAATSTSAHRPTSRSIQSISTAIPGVRIALRSRETKSHTDPADHIIAVANNQPLTATATTPATPGNPCMTFINALTLHQVLGHDHVRRARRDWSSRCGFRAAPFLHHGDWISQQRREQRRLRGAGGVIDPTSMKVEKSLKPGMCHPSAEALGPSQHILLSCGAPIVLSATDGRIISTITQTGAGDENWYNPGTGGSISLETTRALRP